MKTLILGLSLLLASPLSSASDLEVKQLQMRIQDAANGGGNYQRDLLKEIRKGLAGKSDALSSADSVQLISNLLEDADKNPTEESSHWWQPKGEEKRSARNDYGDFLDNLSRSLTDHINKKSNTYKEGDRQALIKAALIGTQLSGKKPARPEQTFFVSEKSDEHLCRVSARVLTDLQTNDELLDAFEKAEGMSRHCIIKAMKKKIRANKKELLLSMLKIVATDTDLEIEDQKAMVEALRPSIVKGLGYPEKEFNRIADLVNADKLQKEIEKFQRTVSELKIAEGKLRSPTEKQCPVKDAEEGNPLIQQLKEHIANKGHFAAPLYPKTEYQVTSNYEPSRAPGTVKGAKKKRSTSSEPNIVESRTFNQAKGLVEIRDITGRVVESKSEDQWHQYLVDLVHNATDIVQNKDGTIYLTIKEDGSSEKTIGINFDVPLAANPVFYETKRRSHSLFSFEPVL